MSLGHMQTEKIQISMQNHTMWAQLFETNDVVS